MKPINPVVEVGPMSPHCVALGHGAQVVVLPTQSSGSDDQHRCGVVALQLWIAGGTAAERPTEHGCAHLLEHMLFKPMANGSDLAAIVEGLGGDVNAFTSHDETVVHITVAVGREGEAIDALLSSVFEPNLSAEALAVESGVVVEEIRQYRDDPGSRAVQALMESLYGRHPYARPVLGTVAEVRGHDAARLRRFHRRVYTARRSSLVVVGPVDPEVVVERARPWLQALSRGSALPAIEPLDGPLTRPRVRVRHADVREAQIQLAWRCPPLPQAEACAIEVASIVLGYGESSRLTRRVRRGERLVSDVLASFLPARDSGSLMISARTEPDQVEPAISAILAEIDALGRVPVQSDELVRARTVLKSDLVYRRETVSGHAHALGNNLSLGGSLDLDARYFAALETLTPSSLRSVCERWLRTSATAVSIVIPQDGRSTARPLRRALIERVRGAGSRRRARPTRPDRHGVYSLRLPGGFRVLAKADPRVPMAAGWMLWPGGLRREDARRNGACAMMARLLTRGCAAIDGDQLAEEVEGAAGALDGFSSRNSTGLHFEGMADRVPLLLRRAIQCALQPQFSTDELEEERRVLLQEIEAEQDEPAKLAFGLAYQRLYRGHSFRWPRHGTPASLARMTSSSLQSAWSRWFPLGAAVLAVCGDIDIDGLFGMLEHVLADVPTTTPPLPPWPGSAPRYPMRPVELVLERDREQSHLVMAMPGLLLGDKSGIVLDVLLAVLGGQAGRLFMALREAEGLVYHVSASSAEGPDAGDIVFYAASGPARIGRAREVLELELRRICDELVGAEELERAKALLVGQHMIGMERHSRIASQLAFNEAFGLGRHSHLRYPEKIERVSAKQIRLLARQLLAPQRRVVAVVGPTIRD